MFTLRRDPARLVEVDQLARYVDAVVSGALAPSPIAELFGRVVLQLRSELRPVDPRPEYASNLRLRLIAAADQREPVVELAAWRQPRFLIGAASLVSAAAVLALVARSRIQARPAA